MTKRLDPEDRGILQFRPNIDFVEPDVEPQAPNPIEPEPERDQLEDSLNQLDQLRALANAVNTLAGAVQARADDKARNLVIDLDSSADTDTVQAMARRFPDSNPNQITYQQYRECKDELRSKGVSLAEQGIKTTPQEIEEADGDAIGGFGTPEAAKGLLRPELRNDFIVIPPLPIPEIQISLICILLNYIWQEFLKPLLIAVFFAFAALPDEICDPGIDIDLPGLIILGKPPVNVPEPPEVPTDTSQVTDL